MPIIIKVWYSELTHSDIAVAPSSVKSAIMVNFYSYSQIYSPSRDVSPTIHFGSLVFEHHGDFDMKLTGIDDLDLTHAGREVFTSFGQIPEDIADSGARLDLDYDAQTKKLIFMKAVRSTWPHGTTITPDFMDKMGCIILYAPRDQLHT